ncbi:placenta-specific gene 8 protein [Octopus bimaculoides]|uniref:Uncharacterized protein n=1 Tax=Octopus bimaculoides TaxID=37653 RepID=A0A0L8FP09_OCTBM|nr:placenta-specific gene 8 protein [Octopus bimaculoides]XP_014788169.1 placenta-specific gene 8 protein [Octopus bimaculoides]XP_014788170.1 placenta-specific gene 8 protein [Octopus bimaculoides]|eukprot:XP_014788168.1 PREDICTED: placenta-specific gene 8 protein-like [Octopus bimaculoides]
MDTEEEPPEAITKQPANQPKTKTRPPAGGSNEVGEGPEIPLPHPGAGPEVAVAVPPLSTSSRGRNWSTGLCECRESIADNCVLSFWCWPFMRCNLAKRLNESRLTSLFPCIVFAMRVKVRAELKIAGTIPNDFCAALCCEPCVMCQMSRELQEVNR